MNKAALKSVPHSETRKLGIVRLFLTLVWPLRFAFSWIQKHFTSYITGRVLRDRRRIYSIRFIWYGDTVYLHPMIWGSLLLYGIASMGWIGTGWLLMFWFIGLIICYLTIMYNFDIVKTAILAVGTIALLGVAYFSTVEWSLNPLLAVKGHIVSLGANVSPGFFVIAAYVFALLIASEVIWAWLFHRVEIDESYVYEHRFLKGTTREPIFARGLKRETKDLLELALLGAADIQHRTKRGYKVFKNVPFASLWLGTAVDSLLDHRRDAQIRLEDEKAREDDAEFVRPSDAYIEAMDEMDDHEDHDDHEDMDGDDDMS